MLAPPGDIPRAGEAAVPKPVVNLAELELGYNLTAVPPGKRAFPFHSHRADEEMFFTLEGSGEVRIGGEVHPIRPGDIIACPPGGPETAHPIVNTGAGERRYLAVSTRLSPEIADGPDSGKFGGLAELPGPDDQMRTFRFSGRPSLGADSWDGE